LPRRDYFCAMFKVGDIVSFLNDASTGEVIAINGDKLTIMMDYGFEEEHHIKDLVPRKSLNIGEVQQKDRPKARLEKGKAVAHAPEYLEVDLHFEALVDFPKNFSAHEKLQIQLSEVRKSLDKARRAGIKKVILIHGVGQGRLREEVYTLLERMDRLSFYDASYARYGKGATEVDLR